MKKITINSAIGIAATAIGIWWIFSVLLSPLLNFINEEKDIFDYVFILTVLPLMAIPGILITYFGVQLAKTNTGTNIKRVVGSLSIFGVIWVYSFIQNTFGESKIASGLSMLIATLIIIPVYVVISKFWMKKSGHIPTRGEFVGKGIITVIAWLIWFGLSDIADEIMPIKEGYTHVPEEPYGLIGFIVPILIAVIFYKASMRQINKNVEIG